MHSDHSGPANPGNTLPIQVIIMAGGFGTRLLPLTENLPKPMLPVGDQPLLQRIIEKLRRIGLRRIHIAAYYQPEKIMEYFGDGQSFGVELEYLLEEQPLGTAGAIGLMAPLAEPLLIINGDTLTSIDYRAMLDFHRRHGADLTIATHSHTVQVPYGVLDCDGARVRGMREKPSVEFCINAGIYVMQPSVQQLIARGQHLHMSELIPRLIEADRVVVGFPFEDYWLDIGQHDHYQQAQTDIQKFESL